jgi:hypothetical protein
MGYSAVESTDVEIGVGHVLVGADELGRADAFGQGGQ